MQDDLLRSLVHALSNRVGTVMALSALLDTGTDPARIGKGLGDETERMDQLLRLLRALSRSADPTIEPLLLADAVDVAVRLAAEHVVARAVRVQWADGAESLPVRADPVAVAQAATVALLTVARGVGPDGAIRVDTRVAGTRVELLLRAVEAAGPVAPEAGVDEGAVTIDWLLAASGGAALTSATGGLGFSLPGLGAGRSGG